MPGDAYLMYAVLVLSFVYVFYNGSNDSANAAATLVASRAIIAPSALILISVMNFFGALISTKVAETVGKGIVPSGNITQQLLIAGLIGAILWVGVCTHGIKIRGKRTGIPVSVTHSLVGGLVGAGISSGGSAVVNWAMLKNKVFLAVVLGPTLGFFVAIIIYFTVSWGVFLASRLSVFVSRRKISSGPIDGYFKKLQIISAAFLAFSHGMNDTQNGIGIITASLLAGGYLSVFIVPLWVKLASGFVMGLGTLVLGWKVIQTSGHEITKLDQKQGFSASLAGGAVIAVKSYYSMPVSTTHVSIASIAGAGFMYDPAEVRWSVFRQIFFSWVFTIPFSAATSFVVYNLLSRVL